MAGIRHVALDEMFSQRQPVLGGIDLDSGFLFCLEASPSRTGAEWAEVLGALRAEQGLFPEVVVKDAGSGLALGVQLAWAGIQERDDLFHAVYEVGKVARPLENRAYKAMARVEELRGKLSKAKTEQRRCSLEQELREAEETLERRMERYDRFEVLRRQMKNWLRLAERGVGKVREPAEVTAALQHIAEQMKEIGTDRIKKVATYLLNRAEGLTSYLESLRSRLDAVRDSVGGQDVVEAVVRVWQARLDVDQGGPLWDRKPRRRELQTASEHLVELCWPDLSGLALALRTIMPILAERHRASSAIENLNGVLRPYLVVQKGAQQGFLDLFRFYWNTRKRRWGRLKGTSAAELLLGEPQAHWLTLLGYPPSEKMRAAA